MNRKKFLSILIFIVVAVVTAIVVFFIISFWKGGGNSGTNSGFSLFPNRNSGTTGEDPATTGKPSGDATGTNDGIPGSVSRLRKLADFPVVAITSYTRPEKVIVNRLQEPTPTPEGETPVATEPVFTQEIIDVNQLYARYIKQENGAIYTSKIGSTLTQKQTTKDVIPYAGDGLFDGSGNNVLYRFYNETTNDIETFFGTITEKVIPDAVCAKPFPGALTADSDPLDITLLQEFLAYTLGVDTARDGKIGSGTRTAITTFQGKEGLSKTGSADDATIAVINNRCLEIVEEKTKQKDPIELSGTFLTENITGMTLSPDKSKVFYIAKHVPETIGVVFNFQTRTFKQLLSSPFSEWTPSWHNTDMITMYTKPSGTFSGYLYTIESETGTMHKILDEKRGLLALINPADTHAFITESTGSGMTSSLLDMKTGELEKAPFATLPEKCTWAKDSIILYCAVPEFVERSLYPDDWYKGVISFTDSIWLINTTTGETRQIVDLSQEGGEGFDISTLALDPNELYLLFINKKTGEPWILEI